ncbi:MAG: peptidylprolyl isomerase [Anaerolineae bacterium]
MTVIRIALFLTLSVLILSLAAGCSPSATTQPSATPAALSQAATGDQTPASPGAAAPGATAAPQGANAAAGGQTQPQGDPNVAALVNGDPVSLSDYQRATTEARNFLINDQKVDPNTAQGAEALKTMNSQVLEGLIADVLVQQYAKKNNISVSDDELQKSIDGLIKDMGGQDKFDESLKARGMTLESFRAMQRAQLLGNKVRDAVTKDVPQTQEQVHARHILVQTNDDALKALKRLEAGEDFAKVAADISQDPGTAKNGGDLGWFPRGVMVPEFDQVAFGQPVKKLSSPVQTQFGYHIIQVLEKDANRKLPEQQWQDLRQFRFQDWLEQQRQKADIKRMVGDGASNP